MSPKWKKSRRRKVPDSLKQATIKFIKCPKIQNQIDPSDEGFAVPSGGPLGVMKRERETERGMGDHVEGPNCKRKRED